MAFVSLLLAMQAAVPTLDGEISPGEYDGGTTLTGSTGLVVHVRTTDDAIYVAASGTPGGYPHLATTRGDTVLVLHASAALGTARFAGPASTKSLVRRPNWEVRNAGTGASGVAARDQYYRREGWTATTVEMGTPGVTEFKVSRALLLSGAPLAVTFWSGGAVQRWPTGLNDDIMAVPMIQGPIPATATFTLAEWGRSP